MDTSTTPTAPAPAKPLAPIPADVLRALTQLDHRSHAWAKSVRIYIDDLRRRVDP